MKSKKLFFVGLCFVSLVLSSTSSQKNVDYSYENPIEENIVNSLNLDYKRNGNGYSIKNGRTISNAVYDEQGNLISISSSRNDTKKSRTKDVKQMSQVPSNVVNTNLIYDDDNRLVNISTINQNISFIRDKNIIKKVEINGDVMFGNKIIENNKVVQEFANKTQIVKTQLASNKYAVKYGNLNEFSITTNNNEYPTSIVESGSGKVTYYDYDSDGILTSLENEYGKISRTNDYLKNNSFGLQLISNFSNNSLLLSFEDSTSSHQLTKVYDSNNLSFFEFDGREIYTIKTSDSISGYDGYDDILGNAERYTFNNLGYLTSVTNNGELVKKYSYDDYGKLTGSFAEGILNQYIYDNSGNLRSEEANNDTIVYQYDNDKNLNQLTSINGEKLEYDDLGNLVHFKESDFAWDGGQLLKSSVINGKSSKYEYGADKIRTKRVVGDRSIDYQYFNGYLMASNDNNKGVTLYFYDDENHALGFTFNEEIYVYVKDPLGVIRGIINKKMEPVVVYSYDDWGTPFVEYCSSQDVMMANMIIYKDYVYDYESNLYYLGSRYYSPEIRRFISQDNLEKVGETGSKDYNYNLYSYCNNNPIMLSDQFGYEAITLTFSTLFLVFACVIALVVVSFLVTKIMEEVVKAFKPYLYNISNKLTQTKNDFYNLVNKFKKEALLAFGEYILTIWMWWVDNGKQEHHHIIAKTSSKCATARRLFTVTYKYSINDEANMVWLKYRLHKHLHTDAYYFAVNTYTVLGNNLGGKYLFLAHLAEIKGALLLLNSSLIF